jgi:hypothetical protein
VFLDADGNVLGRVRKVIKPRAMLKVVVPASKKLAAHGEPQAETAVK